MNGEMSGPGDFSVALSILRLSRGWSQDQLARAAGITNSALSEYERGKKVPELKSVRKLVTALGYELSAIERTESFLLELRTEGLLEARPESDGSYSVVPLAARGRGEEPELRPGRAGETKRQSLRAKARRTAAHVGQAATGFCYLLFEILIGDTAD